MTVINSPLGDALRDRYLLERELGRGGMATVYLARDLQHERPVALKVLHPELAHALGPERFVREVRITARFSIRHICPTERVPGPSVTLGQALSRSFPCPTIFSRSLKRR